MSSQKFIQVKSEDDSNSKSSPLLPMKVMKAKKTFECTVCHRVLSAKDHLKNHIARFHAKTSPRCEICGAQFCTPYSVRRHVNQVHHGLRLEFKCGHCWKVFENRSKLKDHLNVEHVEFGQCGKDSSEAKFEPTLNNSVNCPYCGVRCLNPSNVEVHIALVHQTRLMVRCSKCNLGFFDQFQLSYHQMHGKCSGPNEEFCESKNFEDLESGIVKMEENNKIEQDMSWNVMDSMDLNFNPVDSNMSDISSNLSDISSNLSDSNSNEMNLNSPEASSNLVLDLNSNKINSNFTKSQESNIKLKMDSNSNQTEAGSNFVINSSFGESQDFVKVKEEQMDQDLSWNSNSNLSDLNSNKIDSNFTESQESVIKMEDSWKMALNSNRTEVGSNFVINSSLGETHEFVKVKEEQMNQDWSWNSNQTHVNSNLLENSKETLKLDLNSNLVDQLIQPEQNRMNFEFQQSKISSNIKFESNSPENRIKSEFDMSIETNNSLDSNSNSDEDSIQLVTLPDLTLNSNSNSKVVSTFEPVSENDILVVSNPKQNQQILYVNSRLLSNPDTTVILILSDNDFELLNDDDDDESLKREEFDLSNLIKEDSL